MGMVMPTNFPRCKDGTSLGHEVSKEDADDHGKENPEGKNWSRNSRFLNTDLWSTGGGPTACCSLSFSSCRAGVDTNPGICVSFSMAM